MVTNARAEKPGKVALKMAVSAVLFAGLCAAASRLAGGAEHGRWYSIAPPLLAIFLAFLTRHVIFSLGLAFLVGGLLCHVPEAPLFAGSWSHGYLAAGAMLRATAADVGNLKILAFIPPVFVMIELIIASGGFNGVVLWLMRWIRGKRSAQTQTAVLGVLCFIDDYANAIIVGSMMQPVTDRFRISREKLAFIVDATSAPISGLAIVSTWIAYEVGLFGTVSAELGFGRGGYAMFFDALSYRFYCLFMILFVFVNILAGRDFGPMRRAEAKAEGGGLPTADDGAPALRVEGRALNAVIPLAAFLGFHVCGLWLDGGGPAKLAAGGSPGSWVYWQDVIGHAENSTVMLAGAAVFGLTVALACGLLTRALPPRAVGRCFCNGVKRAMMPACVLVLAWSLKRSCDTLQTGEFLTGILAERISPLAFPAILFAVASLTSFATGTSWGTMAILIPTGIPIAFAMDGGVYGLTTMISLGAVLDGAIFGDHCSPISDTTIISSVSADCDLMQHVRTQLPYSLSVAAVALACGYIPSVFGVGWAYSAAAGAAAMATLFGVVILCRRPSAL
ncbi:MAG: hypothetical protein IH624_03380 [Phycisphaerae bacterium]|nr:hypothetical protein [Phycisphaerae bacterium]